MCLHIPDGLPFRCAQAEQVRQAEGAAAAATERRRQLELRTAERTSHLQHRCVVRRRACTETLETFKTVTNDSLWEGL